MSAQSISELFDGLFGGAAATATAPLVALGVGVLLLLVADVVSALRPARPVVFLASLGASAWACVGLFRAPTGAVLDGTYTGTQVTALWGALFLASTALAWAYSRGYYEGDDAELGTEHDLLLLSAAAGMMLMVGARDLLVFFLGLELLSIPLYTLAAFRRARSTSVEAGLKYFLLGAFAAGFYLYGAALLYSQTGTLSLEGLIAAERTSPLALAGAALVAASVLFKLGAVPFHLWVPDVYQGSPTPIAGLMATGTKAAAIGFLVEAAALLPPTGATTIAVIALATMAVGNLGALVQDDLKRLLAYSGVAHAGTLLLVVAALLAGGGDAGAVRTAALYYMGAYVFTASGAFGLIALLERDGERFTKLSGLRGLARTRPGVAAALALFMLSLAGIPATGGFLGKYFVFSVLIDAELYAVAVIGVLLTLIAFGYYLRVIVAMYMEPALEGAEPSRARCVEAGIATAVCALLVLLLGLLPGLFLR